MCRIRLHHPTHPPQGMYYVSSSKDELYSTSVYLQFLHDIRICRPSGWIHIIFWNECSNTNSSYKDLSTPRKSSTIPLEPNSHRSTLILKGTVHKDQLIHRVKALVTHHNNPKHAKALTSKRVSEQTVHKKCFRSFAYHRQGSYYCEHKTKGECCRKRSW